MPAIKKDLAIRKLTAATHVLPQDDMVDVCNELFPEDPSDIASVKENPRRFQKRISDHIDKGLEVEEILDLWRVVFPKDRRVHFNEDTNELMYQDQQFLHAALRK